MARNNFQKRTYSAAPERIIEVFVDAQHMPITVQPYAGDALVIDYYSSEEQPYEAYNDGGIVMLTCPQTGAQGGLAGMLGSLFGGMRTSAWTDLPINIYVPRAFGGMLNLCTTHARISVSNLELRDRLHASTRNAMIDIRGVIATVFELSTTNAKIYAENAACGQPVEGGQPMSADSTLTSSNGSIQLTSFSTLGALSLHTSNSPIHLSDVAVQGPLTCVTSNAGINMDNTSVQDVCLCESSNGGMRFSRLLAHDIELRTSNGSIRGSIQGRYEDFAVECGTSNGKCNLASSSARTGRYLRAHTSNASLLIDFEE